MLAGGPEAVGLEDRVPPLDKHGQALEAQARVDDGGIVLKNEVLACRWTLADGRLKPAGIVDKLSGANLSLEGAECFCFSVARTPGPDWQVIRASELKLAGAPKVSDLKPDETSRRLGDRVAGRTIVVDGEPLELEPHELGGEGREPLLHHGDEGTPRRVGDVGGEAELGVVRGPMGGLVDLRPDALVVPAHAWRSLRGEEPLPVDADGAAKRAHGELAVAVDRLLHVECLVAGLPAELVIAQYRRAPDAGRLQPLEPVLGGLALDVLGDEPADLVAPLGLVHSEHREWIVMPRFDNLLEFGVERMLSHD